jgi:Concanavalin A-like lectin/glucanases superfamily
MLNYDCRVLRNSLLAVSAIGGLLVAGCGESVVAFHRDLDAGRERRDAATTASPAPDVVTGLVLHLAFNESEAGAITLDGSGGGHNGTPSPSPPSPSPATPPVGFDNPRSLEFTGDAQFVDLGNPTTLNISGELTVCAWIRPRSLSGYHNIVAHGFRWDPDEEVVLRILDGYYEFLSWDGEWHRTRAPIGAGDVDNWHYLCGVYEDQTYRLYRDAVLIAETVDVLAPMTVDAPWAIGGRSTVSPDEPRGFAGLIDEVRVYERALSVDALRVLFRL